MQPHSNSSDVRTVVGHHPETGQYYERIGEPTAFATPVLWISGGGRTGAVFREGAEPGEPGWADRFAAKGAECWVPDWVGSGRSGARRDRLKLRYRDVIDGYIRLVTDVIARPVTIVCHSMGGAIAWALVEALGDQVTGVVGLAPAPLGNGQPASTTVNQPDKPMVFALPDGMPYTVRPDRLVIYDRDYSLRVWTPPGSRFPPEKVDWAISGGVGLSPVMLLERMGVIPGLPRITNTDAFAGKPITVITGSMDPGHPRRLDQSTADLLASWGADVRMCWLADHGLVGNSHFLFWDSNESDVFEFFSEALAAMLARATEDR